MAASGVEQSGDVTAALAQVQCLGFSVVIDQHRTL